MVQVTLIRGDGIGPEIVEQAVAVIEATGAKITWEERQAGLGAIKSHGAPLPRETADSIRKNGFCLKGPLSTPIGGGYSSVNVAIRQEFELFANVRPARSVEGVDTPFKGVDLVVIRENTQELYSGIEFYTDAKKDCAQAISLITRAASERVIRFAFEYARANKRKRVTLVHKANILKLTSGMFLSIGQELSKQYPDIQFDDRIVDATAMLLVRSPERFDVLVTTNLFGDILSDLTAGLIGGLGLAPSGNIGDGIAIFEAIHGTAPDIAGKGIANPTALILSGAMLLRRIGYGEQGDRVERAVLGVLKERKIRTSDIGGTATCAQFGQAVTERARG